MISKKQREEGVSGLSSTPTPDERPQRTQADEIRDRFLNAVSAFSGVDSTECKGGNQMTRERNNHP